MQIEKKYYRISFIGTVVFLFIISGFSQTLGNWTVINYLNVPRSDNVAVIAQDTLMYTFGGQAFTNTIYPVERSTILPNGYLSPWSIESSQMLSARDLGVGASANGYIYAIGGEDEYANLTTVECAKVNPDGTLSAWTVISAYTAIFYASTLIQTSTFIYVIGGTYAGDPYIYRASLNPDGTIGTWTLLSSQLNVGRVGHMSILMSTTLYVIDGAFVSGLTKSVEKATVSPDGELSAFTTISNTVSFHILGDCVYDGQYLYVIGGYQYGGPYPSERAKVNPDGSLGTWGPASSFQILDRGGGFVQTTTAAYSVGGLVGDSDIASVEYAPIFPTSPPTFPSLPSLKLFSNQSFYHAFNMEDFNTGDISTSYSILSNFLSLSSLDSSSVNQNAYDFPTTGTNIYLADNAYGEGTATNEVKYSTYKINKLPHVGVALGSSYELNLANYTFNISGQALPPSFGIMDSLTTDNPAITATWLNNSTIQITSVSALSGMANVYVSASSNATSPFGSDVDVERIQVYPNLLSNGTFSTANDTTIWSPMEIPPGRTTMATQQWIPSYTDSAGTQATGVWKFTFADTNGGVKATPGTSNWINITNGQWYTFRIRLVADSTNNSHQALLFGYTNYVGSGIQTDIVGNVLFGVPTVWTWQEAPLLAHGSSALGYPQFQFKAGGAGSIYVDEVQILNATPALLEARSNTKSHYLYGQFTTGNDTTGWGQQIYFGAGSAPEISVGNGLVLNFAGATSGSGQEGIKWTANNGVPGSGHAYSFPVNLNHDINVGLTLNIQLGNFNSLGIVLAAAYGIQTSGQQDIGTPPSNLIAVAGVGVLNSGNYSAEGIAVNPYYQGQFGVRSDTPGILVISNVDVNVDNDDPNFGDATLFP